MKAKTLTHDERIALTQGKFPRKMAPRKEIERDFALREIKPMQVENALHFDKCPMCGAYALIHEGGCEHCTNCAYDACGLH